MSETVTLSTNEIICIVGLSDFAYEGPWRAHARFPSCVHGAVQIFRPYLRSGRT